MYYTTVGWQFSLRFQYYVKGLNMIPLIVFIHIKTEVNNYSINFMFVLLLFFVPFIIFTIVWICITVGIFTLFCIILCTEVYCSTDEPELGSVTGQDRLDLVLASCSRNGIRSSKKT